MASSYSTASVFSRLLSSPPLQRSSPWRLLPRLQTSAYEGPALFIPTISLNLPALLSDIWEGVLRAVPKKKTSHMKRRHRQLAGKALKDVTSLHACPACGEPKRAHHLCPNCVEEIRNEWMEAAKEERRKKLGIK